MNVLRQFFNVGKPFHDLGLPCLQDLATPLHLGDVGLEDEHCDALPFLDSVFKLFHCFFGFVAFAALIQSAFFEGDLSALSSSREARGVEERDVFDFVFVLIGMACASALMAPFAS